MVWSLSIDRRTWIGPRPWQRCSILVEISQEMKLVFPVHPRTKGRLEAFGLLGSDAGGNRHHPAAALGISGLPGAHIAGQGNHNRLWRTPGGIDGLGRTLSDHARKHGTADHGRRGYQHVDRKRRGEASRESRAGAARHVQAGRCPELWDGQAAVRMAEVIVSGTRDRSGCAG